MAKWEQLGALWLNKETNNYGGTLQGADILANRVENKKSDKSPDFRLSLKDKGTEVGALWAKVSKAGKNFLSGKVESVGDVVVFPNGYKEEDKHPDLVIYKSQPKEPVKKFDDHQETDVPF